VKQRREQESRSLVLIQRGPVFKHRQLLANELGVGPDIALGMPFGILLTFSHWTTPGLALGPEEHFVDACHR
jgi:hypothetical protein